MVLVVCVCVCLHDLYCHCTFTTKRVRRHFGIISRHQAGRRWRRWRQRVMMRILSIIGRVSVIPTKQRCEPLHCKPSPMASACLPVSFPCTRIHVSVVSHQHGSVSITVSLTITVSFTVAFSVAQVSVIVQIGRHATAGRSIAVVVVSIARVA